MAQLDSTRLSARWQQPEREEEERRGRESSRAEEVRASVRERRTGLGVAGAGAGAVGALLFAVEGGGSWGRKGGRRIDPDGAWLTADEAVTRDESRRDGRTEKAFPPSPSPSRTLARRPSFA